MSRCTTWTYFSSISCLPSNLTIGINVLLAKAAPKKNQDSSSNFYDVNAVMLGAIRTKQTGEAAPVVEW
jgi:hypothetical protein